MNAYPYHVGDRVAHRTCGHGTVTAIDSAGVHVTYDKIGASGQPWAGIYNHAWFRDFKLERLSGTEVRLVFEPREDGGLRLWSPDIPGLVLSAETPIDLLSDVGGVLWEMHIKPWMAQSNVSDKAEGSE